MSLVIQRYWIIARVNWLWTIQSIRRKKEWDFGLETLQRNYYYINL